MKTGTILLILGGLVALSPFSGLPLLWIDIIVPLLGLAIVLIGYGMRRRTFTDAHEHASS